MFPDYQALVMQHYEKKLNENQLSSRLSHPTTAKFKTECIERSTNGFLPKDRKTLVDFFGENGNDQAILEEIATCYPDIFRPLLNYLNKKTSNTNPKNIELLAWLTDFEPRPYERGRKYIFDEFETSDTAQEELHEGEQEAAEEQPTDGNKKPESENKEAPPKGPTIIIIEQKIEDDKKKTSLLTRPLVPAKQPFNPKIIGAALLVFISAAIGFVVYSTNKGENCMYWAGDHYQQIPCNQKIGSDTTVIALDMERLNTLKKITQPDTITYNSIGKVWYVKISKDSFEYYTADGDYPLNRNLRLKPITKYIIDKHILNHQQDTAQ